MKAGFISLIVLTILFFSFSPMGEEPVRTEVDHNARLFSAVFKTVNENFVDSLDPKRLSRVAIDAMMHSLDPYSVYLDEEETKNREKVWQGSLYAGIGAGVAPRDSMVLITDPYDGYGAHRAGFRPGDYIYAINDTSVKGVSFEQVVKRLKGQPGTYVKVTVDRPGKGLITATIQRQQIYTKSILFSGLADSVTGYIRVSQFLRGSDIEFKNRLVQLKSLGAKYLILDLRDNIGGLVQEAVNCLSCFLPKGTRVCSVKGLHIKTAEDYITSLDPVDVNIPIAVLTNGVTVSSGEIFTGAIQDLDRGVIIGQRTFGKGFVQGTRFPGFGTSVYLTAGRYYTPSGRCVQELDYSKKQTGEGVTVISKELRREFKTRNGRTVYDIGGISPDVKTESNRRHELLINLMQSRFYFDFLTRVSANSEPPQDASRYKASEQIIELFYKEAARPENISQLHFSAERELQNFKDKATQDGLTASLKGHIHRMEKAIEREKLKSLVDQRKEVGYLLSSDLVRRYHNQTGVFIYMLANDRDLLLASKMLKNEKEFRKILNLN